MTNEEKTNLHNARNAMSDGHLRYLYEHAMSHTPVFDLQRFGHHHGKSGGKIFASIAGFIVGFTTPWLFGVKAFAAGVMGASLFGSVWSATHQQNVDTGSADVSRFDRAQETMSSDGQIPVVYGTRQISGNQTFHQTNADANTLHKHVVLCEGGIEGVVSVTANDMIIPTGSQTSNTVFTLMNNKYPNARVRKHGSDFDLWAGEYHHHIHLCTKKEVENSHDTYWEYQVSVTSLISYINQLYAEGWQAFPCAATNNYPGDLWDVEGVVYTETTFSKIFGHGHGWQKKNYVAIDATHGFVNFCADTIRGGTNYTFHDGDTPSNYDTVGGYPAMAWLDMNFIVSNELNGNPSVSAVVMGKKVYDTRTKKTEYSTNPAMCLRDFMLSKRYGLGRWISADDLDEDSWNKAADYCDEEISFLDASGAVIKAKRFELNMVIDQKNNALDWLQEILANFQGYLTLTNGKFKLHIESQTDISYKFNDDNCSDLSVTPLSLNDTPNKYVVKIIDPRNNWSTVACNVEDYADQKERQKIITKEVNLNGTTSQYQALRLARFYRDQNLACPLTLSWKTGINGMHLEPGDVVTISYHGVFTELPVRITEIKQDDDGKFDITGRQYNDTIYGDALGGGVHWYNYTDTTQTVEKRTPSNPTHLKAYTQYRRYEDGTTGYDVICSYELPQRYDVETGLVYYKTNHMTGAQIGTFKEGEVVDSVGLSREWIYAGDSPTKIVIPNAKVGDIYEFRVQSRTTDGLISSEASAPTVTIKVTAKETVPSQPYNLTYDFTKAFTFKWSDVPDSDVMYYEIRTDTNVGSPVGLLGKTQSTSIDVNLMERRGTVYVYSVNTLKKYSYPAKVIYNYPKPDAPSYIHFTEALRGVNVLVAPFPARVKSMRLYVEGHGISKSFDLDNASYTFNSEPDIYYFWASYVDLMGEGYTSVQ
ncbi:phage tail protein, partial [Mitsuokella jalaludinii]|uniref:phage tail protein n=1 Tax=Mitsuokella jalaludinii TaxID=187979 RepID=UPI003079253D